MFFMREDMSLIKSFGGGGFKAPSQLLFIKYRRKSAMLFNFVLIPMIIFSVVIVCRIKKTYTVSFSSKRNIR